MSFFVDPRSLSAQEFISHIEGLGVQFNGRNIILLKSSDARIESARDDIILNPKNSEYLKNYEIRAAKLLNAPEDLEYFLNLDPEAGARFRDYLKQIFTALNQPNSSLLDQLQEAEITYKRMSSKLPDNLRDNKEVKNILNEMTKYLISFNGKEKYLETIESLLKENSDILFGLTQVLKMLIEESQTITEKNLFNDQANIIIKKIKSYEIFVSNWPEVNDVMQDIITKHLESEMLKEKLLGVNKLKALLVEVSKFSTVIKALPKIVINFFVKIMKGFIAKITLENPIKKFHKGNQYIAPLIKEGTELIESLREKRAILTEEDEYRIFNTLNDIEQNSIQSELEKNKKKFKKYVEGYFLNKNKENLHKIIKLIQKVKLSKKILEEISKIPINPPITDKFIDDLLRKNYKDLPHIITTVKYFLIEDPIKANELLDLIEKYDYLKEDRSFFKEGLIAYQDYIKNMLEIYSFSPTMQFKYLQSIFEGLKENELLYNKLTKNPFFLKEDHDLFMVFFQEKIEQMDELTRVNYINSFNQIITNLIKSFNDKLEVRQKLITENFPGANKDNIRQLVYERSVEIFKTLREEYRDLIEKDDEEDFFEKYMNKLFNNPPKNLEEIENILKNEFITKFKKRHPFYKIEINIERLKKINAASPLIGQWERLKTINKQSNEEELRELQSFSKQLRAEILRQGARISVESNTLKIFESTDEE